MERMERVNLFKNMKNEELKKAYRSYIRIQIDKKEDEEILETMVKEYHKQVGERVMYHIMYDDMFNEIARRWCKIMGDLNEFKDVINIGMTEEYLMQ